MSKHLQVNVFVSVFAEKNIQSFGQQNAVLRLGSTKDRQEDDSLRGKRDISQT